MPYATCRHIKEDGHLCQSPAMNREHYCYFHHNYRARRMKIAQARANGERLWLDLPPLEDMRAVQAGLSQVIEPIAGGVIELKRARVLLTALRLAAYNFKTSQAWTDRSQYEVDELHESVAAYPGLTGEYGLPPNIDLDADPEEVFPTPKPKPGAPPLTRFVGHKRSALGCRTAPGIVDICKRLGPDDQLAMLQEIRTALAEGLGLKKPPTSASPATSARTQSVAEAGS